MRTLADILEVDKGRGLDDILAEVAVMEPQGPPAELAGLGAFRLAAICFSGRPGGHCSAVDPGALVFKTLPGGHH